MTEKKDVVVKVKGLAFNLTNKPEKKDVKDTEPLKDRNNNKDSPAKKDETHGKT